jgi:hypothetical protein
MTTYNLLGEGIVTGNNAIEIVENLRNKSMLPLDSVKEFMAATAKACKDYNGSDIRTINYVCFVKDLKDNGFLFEGQEKK